MTDPIVRQRISPLVITSLTATVSIAADSMTLTKIVGPEFFAPGNSAAEPVDPVEIAGKTFNRIYAIAGGGIVLSILGFLIVAAPVPSDEEQGQADA